MIWAGITVGGIWDKMMKANNAKAQINHYMYFILNELVLIEIKIILQIAVLNVFFFLNC